MSTASHNWSKVLMGEWSHPPCEGWRGNVAGGNGFSQFTETEGGVGWGVGGSLGATVAHRTVRLPRLCRRFPDGPGTRRCSLCLSVCLRRCSGEAVAFDYYFGPFFPGWIDADTLAYS